MESIDAFPFFFYCLDDTDCFNTGYELGVKGQDQKYFYSNSLTCVM